MVKTQPDISQSYYRRKRINKGTHMNTANAQTRVIQCPSCQTKFAVKTSMLAGASTPRFHCSRCDHVFSLEQQMEIPLDMAPAHDPIKETPFEESPFAEPSFSDQSESSDWTVGPLDQEEQELESGMEETVEIPSFESIIEDAPQQPSNPTPTEDLEINRMNSAKTTEMPGAVRREALDQMDMVLNPRIRRPRFNSLQDQDSFADELAEPETEPTPPLPEKKIAAPVEPVQQEMPGPFGKKTDSWSIDAPVEDTLASKTLGGTSLQQAAAAARFGRWKSAATLGIPLIGFLALLLLTGFVLSQNPETAWAIGNSVTGSTTRVAPAGLYMNDVSHQEVELESGELVHVISGSVHNTTAETFSVLTLEGLTFNAAGRLLTRTLVPANSTLGKTRIKSLSLEMIRNLQDNSRNARFSLGPDETQDFTIAIIHEDPVNVAYYSARVYSVN